ncbi:TonB family protein [Methylocystis sp. Sn-Cys]|uniref:TonB family protein n=1 Tax=Methylocystis sp. Sn-Cys TaxID=1701263 RepID=UPI001920F7FA|nr:TonB family protein [Methylocystis sp. Sn-Cys]MBL1255267.1 TonB family protein [Methylocystis sp. Sn-Cys]
MANHAQFGIFHGIAGSLAVHSFALLVLWGAVGQASPEIDDTLLVEFNGVDSDVQAEEKHKRQNAGSGGAVEAQNAKQEKTEEKAEKKVADDEALPERIKDAVPDKIKKEEEQVAAAAKPSASAQQAGRDVEGIENEQHAQIIQRRTDAEMNVLKAYIRNLSKKIQTKLLYPKEARHSGLQGVTTVSFRIKRDGTMHPDSLKIVASSGRAELDISALDTVRACAPFSAPPKDVTVTMAVTYARKR